MNAKRLKRASTAIAAGLLALGLVWFIFLCRGYSRPEGDGILIDNGLFADYPRYELRFEGFSLTQRQSTHRYQFRNPTPVSLELRLYHQNARTTPSPCIRACPHYQALDRAKTSVRAILYKNRAIIAQTENTPLADAWSLSKYNYWDDWDSELVLSKSTEKANYELVLEIESAQPLPIEVILQPALVGGSDRSSRFL